MTAVFWKELADHFGRRRFFILLGLIIFASVWAAFVAVRSLRDAAGAVPSDLVFLQLFTGSSGAIPPFLFFLSFFGPLIGITLGFDAINSERSQGTLARVLSQPVYRDALFNGKFLAGLTTIAVLQVSIVLIVVGLGMFILGFGPTLDFALRIGVFTVASIIYMAFWLAIAMLCSVWFNQAVSSAMTSLALWLFFGFIMLIVAGAIAEAIVPDPDTEEEFIDRAKIERMARRFSPVTLFQEATVTILTPTIRSLGPALVQEGSRLERLRPLPLNQSLNLVWPHLVAILALAGICFGISYAKFLREEIRP